MINLYMAAFIRIFALVATGILAPEIAGAQCERLLPSRCSTVDKTRTALSLVYERENTLNQKNRGGRKVLWFRFTNNSNWDAYVATLTPYRSTTGRGRRIRTTRNGERVKIIYVLDDQWGWGHSFGAFIVKSRSSILFALPREELVAASNLWVLITFDLETPFTCLEINIG